MTKVKTGNYFFENPPKTPLRNDKIGVQWDRYYNKEGYGVYCAKCGREISEKAVFCNTCLEVMERYPIKPGTSIQLPQRVPSAPKKPNSRKRQLSPEEQLAHQRITIRVLAICLTCAMLLLGLCAMQIFHLLPEDEATVTIGQNYMTREAIPHD